MTVFGAVCFGKEAVTAHHAGKSLAERHCGSFHAVHNQQIHIWKGAVTAHHAGKARQNNTAGVFRTNQTNI